MVQIDSQNLAMNALTSILGSQTVEAPSPATDRTKVTKPVKSAPASSQGLQPTLGKIRYTQRPPNNQDLYAYIYQKPDSVEKWSNTEDFIFETQRPIEDIHSSSTPFTLEQNGFQLEPFHVAADIDWHNDDEIKGRYWPQAAELLKKVTGATRVRIFDHTIRRGAITDDNSNAMKKGGQPVPRAHVDYTVKSGPERLQALLPAEEVAKLQKTPFAVIQVWRPLVGPIVNSPLAMADASTVDDKNDLLQNALIFPERTGYTYSLAPNPNHRWYYAKGMTTEEAYIFTCYDSRGQGRARFTPHTGFRDPATPADAPPRESIEIRAYVFWEDLPEQEIAREL